MLKRIKVCHIAHGDLWAGAEVQLVTLLEALARDPRWELSAILLNDGRLAIEIGKLGIPVTVLAEGRHLMKGTFGEVVNNLEVQEAYLGARKVDA